MATRLRVSEAGTRATAADVAANPAVDKVLTAVAGGPGLDVEWKNIFELYAAAWAVTDWYLDGTVGNDANDGTTAATPLRTGAELLRRLGPYAMWAQSVTVHVLANGMVDALILRGVMLVAGSHLDVIGTPTVLASDVLSAYSAVNHATPVATHVTGTTIADFSPYQWRRLRLTSGASVDAVTWIATANPGGLGLAVARVAPFSRINAASTTTTVSTIVTPVVGVTFDVESLPAVPELSLLLDGPTDNAAGAQWPKRQYSIQHIDCPAISTKTSSAFVAAKNTIFGCRFGSLNQEFTTQTPFYQMVCGCSIYNVTPSINAGIAIVNVATNCLFGGPGMTALYAAGINRFTSCLFQGCVLAGQIGSEMVTQNVQIFDCTTATHGAFAPSSGWFTNTSGSNNAPNGIGLLDSSKLRFQGTTNVQGTVQQVELVSAPVTFLTIAQALQPSDYAKHGTSVAMVAGTVTVNVPWYDNTRQTVTATHAAFGGTPGILSVQQISTTQFTITSSNALDTSTVNWQISPLGRNIFISTV